jgi:indole-3-glycerol phosphate synthase
MTKTNKMLDTILEAVRTRLAERQVRVPLGEARRRCEDAPPVRPFAHALTTGGFGLIAEFKRRTPLSGTMRPDRVAEAVAAYATHPIVKSVSVLTECDHFEGSHEDLVSVRANVAKPVLCKNFLLDEYQIYEARIHGADAVLLMACVLSTDELARLHELARSLGMDALVEVHDETEIEKLPRGATLIGVNSRDFGSATLDIDLTTHQCLVRGLPAGAVKVAESGLSPASIATAQEAGFHAALVGTSILSCPEPVVQTLDAFAVNIR